MYICMYSMYIYIYISVCMSYMYIAQKKQLASVTTTNDPGTTIQSQRPAMRAAEC